MHIVQKNESSSYYQFNAVSCCDIYIVTFLSLIKFLCCHENSRFYKLFTAADLKLTKTLNHCCFNNFVYQYGTSSKVFTEHSVPLFLWDFRGDEVIGCLYTYHWGLKKLISESRYFDGSEDVDFGNLDCDNM
jgi:hypothetical protein